MGESSPCIPCEICWYVCVSVDGGQGRGGWRGEERRKNMEWDGGRNISSLVKERFGASLVAQW